MSRQFTLIELLVVVFIIGISLSFAFSSIDDLTPSSRLSATARQLGDYLSLARNEAATQGKLIRVHYDLSDQSYWMEIPILPDVEGISPDLMDKITGGAFEDTAEMPRSYLKQGVEFEDITLSESDVKSRGHIIVEFSPFGFSSGHIVHLKSKEGDQQISIEINALTGVSSYYDTYKRFDQMIVLSDEED